MIACNKSPATNQVHVLDGNGRANGGQEPAGRPEEELFSYKLSKRRWPILAAITTFGLLNGFVNELTAVLGTMVELLGISLDKYVYLDKAFGCTAPAFALPTAWLVDRYGLRPAALCALLLVVLRNGSRALLFYGPWTQGPWGHSLKMLYWTLTSCVGAQVASIYWCLPLKVSEGWFSERERSFAWSCMVAGPSLGMAISSLWTPWAVEATNSTAPLAYSNSIALAISVLALGLGVSRSAPNEAPNARQLAKPTELERRPLGASIKSLATNKDVLLFVVAQASLESGDGAIRSLMQDILAASGFKQTFCGQFLASVAVLSALLQLVSASADPDKTHKSGNSSKCKLYVGLQWFTFALYALTLTLRQLHRHYWWLIIASSLLYTMCKVWTSPVCKNQTAHLIVGSVSEATVGAASTIASYTLANFYTIIFVYFRRVDEPLHPGDPASANYHNSILLLLALVSSSTLLYLLCFSGRYAAGESAITTAAGFSGGGGGGANSTASAGQSGQSNKHRSALEP